MTKTRSRSGAYPFELPYRLISMFSVKGDTVFDPFLGLGTTMFAAMATGRNSIGYEIDANLGSIIGDQAGGVVSLANARMGDRLGEHATFVRERHGTKGTFGYQNEHYGFPVVTRQETDILLAHMVDVVLKEDGLFEVAYEDEAAT